MGGEQEPKGWYIFEFCRVVHFSNKLGFVVSFDSLTANVKGWQCAVNSVPFRPAYRS